MAAASIWSYRSYQMWTALSVCSGVWLDLYAAIAVITSSAFSAPSIFKRGRGPAVASMSSSVTTFLTCAAFSLVLRAAAARGLAVSGAFSVGGETIFLNYAGLD